MTEYDEMNDRDIETFDPERIAYIKPTPADEVLRLGLLPEGIKLPEGVKLYVLHGVDGRVLGVTDAYESAYGAALQHDLTPVSLH